MSIPHARRALSLWGYPSAVTLTRLADANNDVYRADTPEGPMVVRVHRSGGKSARWIATELRLLSHLKGAGLPVSHPLADVIEVEDGGITRACTLLAWLEGQFVPTADWHTYHAQFAGELLAKTHLAMRDFPLMPPLDRPLLDAETLFSQSTQYALDAEAEALLAEHAAVFERVQAQTRAAFHTLTQLGLPMQTIHGDFKPDNILWTPPWNPMLVDFDDCSWGTPAYDVATLWLFLRANSHHELRFRVLSGWAEPLGLTDSAALRTAIEILVKARVALSCRWVASHRHHPMWAGRAAAVIAERLAGIDSLYPPAPAES